MLRTRLTMLTVGALLCSLPLTDSGLPQQDGGAGVAGARGPASATLADLDASALQLVGKRGRRCEQFSARDVSRGRLPRNPATCKPFGLDGGVVRFPIAKAEKRDRRNYGGRAHGSRHRGTDFRARCGTRVRAAHGGKVIMTKRRGRSSVAVSTGPRRLTTYYGPLHKVGPRTGAVVQPGRTLGRVTRVKRRGRCYLHFAVRLKGGARDPLPVDASRWLRRHRGTHTAGLPPGDRRRGIFTVATVNVLGHGHTARGGKKRRQYAGSVTRMRRTVSLLDSNHVNVVGLQEFQGLQRRSFLRLTTGWRVYSDRKDPQDSIAWSSTRFRLLRASTLKIPYFKSGRRMPVVVLRDRGTGRKVTVISVHNPANKGSKPTMQKRRKVALTRELRLVKKMKRRTGAPVLLIGDFNERKRPFFCRMVRHGLTASSGGSRGRRCEPSVGAGVDWIFGTRGVRFLAHHKLDGGLVDLTTDHPIVLARVRR